MVQYFLNTYKYGNTILHLALLIHLGTAGCDADDEDDDSEGDEQIMQSAAGKRRKLKDVWVSEQVQLRCRH